VPEGTALHCRFPAACGRSPRIGQYVVEAVRDCLAKMLYAAGRRDEVNASWGAFWYLGGPGFFYGGRGPQGLPVPQGLYDIHGGGLGAAPTRDGVPSGGQPNIPSGGISDVERIELQYPFVYLSRNHLADGGGAGRWNGGAGTARLALVRGSRDLTVDLVPYAGLPHGAAGLFGGYPSGIGGVRALLEPAADLPARLVDGDVPATADEAIAGGAASIAASPGDAGRAPLSEGWLVSDFTQGGGGFGDPLDREPERVADDVRRGRVTRRAARLLYGVELDETGALDVAATDRARTTVGEERRVGTRQRAPAAPVGDGAWTPLVRFHPLLEIGRAGRGEPTVRCVRCETSLGPAADNYKAYALRRDRSLDELAGRPMPDGSPYLAVFREYACPGCATLLAVDVWCETLGGDEDLWDVAVAVAPS
jgi:N-methylhydantoinase B